MPTKAALTRIVLDLLQDQTAYDFDSALTLWWQDSRDIGGMRLTPSGHEHFQQASFEYWKFDIATNKPVKPVHFLMLTMYLQMPYFLDLGKKRSISFYSSKEATLYALYGDIDKFVNALENFG
jgi:hypothetical protein